MTPPVVIAGACVVEHGRMLLVRKRGQTAWILAGGKLEADETPEAAVVREVAEELGVRFVIDGAHTVWEDDAAEAAPGVRVRVHLFDGAIIGIPSPMAEIEEVAMVDLLDPSVPVAPSLSRQIMPWLVNRDSPRAWPSRSGSATARTMDHADHTTPTDASTCPDAAFAASPVEGRREG